MTTMPTFLGVSRYLKSVSKADLPIRVKRTFLDGLDGSCERRPKYYLIEIDKTLPEYFAIDVLIHEMAHADSWGMDKDVHGRNWGLSYSRLYRSFLRKYFAE